MEDNPWNVESLEAFTFLKCPECIFDTQKEDIFQYHAFENHPLSIAFFGKNVKNEPVEDMVEETEICDENLSSTLTENLEVELKEEPLEYVEENNSEYFESYDEDFPAESFLEQNLQG